MNEPLSPSRRGSQELSSPSALAPGPPTSTGEPLAGNVGDDGDPGTGGFRQKGTPGWSNWVSRSGPVRSGPVFPFPPEHLWNRGCWGWHLGATRPLESSGPAPPRPAPRAARPRPEAEQGTPFPSGPRGPPPDFRWAGQGAEEQPQPQAPLLAVRLRPAGSESAAPPPPSGWRPCRACP